MKTNSPIRRARCAQSLLLALCAWCAAFAPAVAQSGGAPQVAAHLSTGVAKLGSEVRLSIEVEGARSATIDQLPAVDGLKFGPLGAPSREESFSILNGRQTQSRKLTWAITVQPSRQGEFTIPPIKVQVDQRVLETRSLALKVVEDLKGDELGVFEIDAPDQIVEGQPFTLEMRFGWDAALNQALNYANLSLPWMGELSGMLELESAARSGNTPSVDLNLNSRDRIHAEQIPARSVNGRTFNMLRVRKTYLATRPGKLDFPTSHFEFGQLIEGGMFSRQPAERRTYFKSFPAFTIDVIKLPEQGRPIDYTGAVGSIFVSASVDRRDVDVGESIKLTVEWTGSANLEFFEPPDPAHMEAFKNFRVFGTTDRKSYERRVVMYDLAPISPDVKAIPPLPLRVYDAAQKAYTSVATDAIPIHVRPLKDSSSLSAEAGRSALRLDIRDIQTHALTQREWPRPGQRTIGAALAVVLCGWVALRTVVRRRGDPSLPRVRARRAARKELARALVQAHTASEQARAFQRFLARRTGEGEQAWVGRDALAWARAHADEGLLNEERARALAQLTARFDERTYAGGGGGAAPDQPLEAREVLATADALIQGGL